jgi:hypothetical protein
MANKDNIKPVTGERDDDFGKPKGTGNVGQSGTVGSEGGGTGSNKGMVRPEDEGRDRDTNDRDLDEDIRPTEKGRTPGSGKLGGGNR